MFLLRPTAYGAIIKMNIDCDSLHIGSTKAGKYVYTILNRGAHTFISKSENNSTLNIIVEGGKIYYIKQQVKMGSLYAKTGLKLLNEVEGKKYLNRCRLSKDNVYSN